MKGKLPAGFRWAGNTLTDGSLRLSIEDSGDSLRVEYDTSVGMVGSAAATIVWAYVPAVAALLRACGWKATPPGGRELADPRDARIAALEAAMLRACADLVRLVAPDHRPGDMVQRADVVEIAMRLKAAMDERRAG